jgi:hypothetical protein
VDESPARSLRRTRRRLADATATSVEASPPGQQRPYVAGLITGRRPLDKRACVAASVAWPERRRAGIERILAGNSTGDGEPTGESDPDLRITSAELIAITVLTESIGARHDEHRAQGAHP